MLPDAHASNPRLAETLREAGLKATGPRLAILAALGRDRSHPTAEQIHADLREDHPNLSLSTVYSTLEAFLAAGLCRRVRGENACLRVDGIPDHHDHAVCTECGRIFDIDRHQYPRPDPPTTLPDGLSVTAVRLEYDVICQPCRATAGDALAAPRRGSTPTTE